MTDQNIEQQPLTEQQSHLASLLGQRSEIQSQLDNLSSARTEQEKLFWKVQGAIEYLAQVGVTLPEPPAPEEAPEDSPVEDGEEPAEEG